MSVPTPSLSAPQAALSDRRKTFRALHEQGCFVIPNPWDVGSARYLRHLGFPVGAIFADILQFRARVLVMLGGRTDARHCAADLAWPPTSTPGSRAAFVCPLPSATV